MIREIRSTTGCTSAQPYRGYRRSSRSSSGISSEPFRRMEQIRDSLVRPIAWNCVIMGWHMATKGIHSTILRKKAAA